VLAFGQAMRVGNLVAASAASAAVLFVSLPAAADCAPGDWFCDESKQKSEGGGTKKSDPSPGEPEQSDAESADETTPPTEPAGDGRAWPPVVHQPSHKLKTATPSKRRAPKRRFGVNAHANFALLGNDPYAHESASMQGAGAAFRFRPMKVLGIDTGFEFIGGRDWNGERRFESALLVHALLFVNPADRLELHVLSGFGLSQAFVRDSGRAGIDNRRYGYFGWDLGFGIDWYVTKRVAIGLELLGLVRVRTNDRRDDPEFVDPGTHRATNASAGGLFRPGVTFYW
jgi:hypothetical protein